jgi:hypothetical protein
MSAAPPRAATIRSPSQAAMGSRAASKFSGMGRGRRNAEAGHATLRKGGRGGGMTVSAATVLLACVACGSAHHAANRLSLTDLRDRAGGCPLPLAKAATDTGDRGGTLTGSPQSIDIGPDTADFGTIAAVDCTLRLSGTDRLNLTAVAVQHGPATQLLLPALQQDGHMTVTELRAVPRPADQAGIGQLIPLSTSDSVALVKINVSGAHSAAFVLSSPSLRPADVDQTATQLAREID